MIKINSLYEKEIISLIDGCRIGEIYDIELEESSGRIVNLIISGKLRFFGLLGRKDPRIIPWEQVRVIGKETILVDVKIIVDNENDKNLLRSFFD